MISLLSYLSENYYRPQDQMGFRDPATALMENIIDLHHFIFFFFISYYWISYLVTNSNHR